MKIVILDQLGCYASVVAASYLAGLINNNASALEIYNLPCFAAHRDLQVGKIYYVGTDDAGNDIYCLGVGGEAKLIAKSSDDLFKIIGIDNEVCIIGVSSINPRLISIFSIFTLWKPIERIAKLAAAIILRNRMMRLIDLVIIELVRNGYDGGLSRLS